MAAAVTATNIGETPHHEYLNPQALTIHQSNLGLTVSSVAWQEADAVASQVKELKAQLGTDSVDHIVEEYPRQDLILPS